MKILCLCNHGNVRSVALAYLIKIVYSHDVLTAGVEENSQETLNMLENWAEMVIFLTKEARATFAPLAKKTAFIDVGKDVWHNPFAQELQHELLKRLKSLDL